MYRSNTCGELRLQDAGKDVTLAGWVQRTRKMGGMTFVDVRDRYGITQVVFNESVDADLCAQANKLGREYCVQVKGTVSERSSKNPKMPTGDIEINAKEYRLSFFKIKQPCCNRRTVQSIDFPRKLDIFGTPSFFLERNLRSFAAVYKHVRAVVSYH